MKIKKVASVVFRIVLVALIMGGLISAFTLDGIICVTIISVAACVASLVVEWVASPNDVSSNFLRGAFVSLVGGGFVGVFGIGGLILLLVVGIVAWGFPKFIEWLISP